MFELSSSHKARQPENGRRVREREVRMKFSIFSILWKILTTCVLEKKQPLDFIKPQEQQKSGLSLLKK